MTESKTPLTSEQMSEPTTKVSSSNDAIKKNAAKNSDAKESDVKKSSPSTSPNKMSKLALIAVLIAITAPASHYYWQQLQNQQLKQTIAQSLTSKISEANNATLSRYKNEMQQALTSQQQSFAKQLQQIAEQISHTNQTKITTLVATVKHLEQRLQQRQPSDWLVHEAEYLIRIAARTLWLEHDTSAAIGLLKDADARLTELNDPAFLPVRETIHQDINALALMPKLETDDVILALMTMNKQVAQLPLAMVDLGAKENKEADVNLSNDINDWQSNLAKTWQKFLNDFIRVRQRTGTIDALISPDQQENLKQNISLKIQLALWAASERKGELYQKALVDIQQWLNEFFDMENNLNQHFANALTSLQNKKVTYNYPSELGSLTAIRSTLRNQLTQSPLPVEAETNSIENKAVESKSIKSKSLQKPQEEIKAELENPVQLPAQPSDQSNDQTKSEGKL